MNNYSVAISNNCKTSFAKGKNNTKYLFSTMNLTVYVTRSPN